MVAVSALSRGAPVGVISAIFSPMQTISGASETEDWVKLMKE
jgi:hypothetical protein